MSDITMDEISVVVSGSSDKATDSIERLITALDKLEGSISNAFSNLKGSNSKLNNFSNNTDKNMKKIEKSFSSARSKILKFGTQLGITGYSIGKSVSEMSDYISTQVSFNKILGTSENNLNRAREFVNDLTNAWYLDGQEVMRATSRYFTMTKTMGMTEEASFRMSKNLTMLSYDLQLLGTTGARITEVQNQIASALRGEAEGLAKYGISLNQATLQSVLYEKGINRTVSSLTAAQKAELIYYQIMRQTAQYHGYYAEQLKGFENGLLQPAMAMQILRTQALNFARALGSVFIPMLSAALPYLIALTQLLTELAKKIAGFFGFKLADWSMDTSEITGGFSDIGESADKAGKKIKGALGDFDELHTISFPDASGALSGIGAGGSLGLDASEFEYPNELLGVTNEKLEKAKKIISEIGTLIAGFTLGALIGKFLEWLKILDKGYWLVTAIGAGLMAFGLKLTLEGITESDLKKKILGALSVGSGFGLAVGFIGKSLKLGFKAGLFISVLFLEISTAISIVKWWNEHFEEQKQKIYGNKKELDLGEMLVVGFSAIGQGALDEIGKLFGLEDFSTTVSKWAKDNKETVNDMVKGMELSFDLLSGNMIEFGKDLEINWVGIKDSIVKEAEETSAKVTEKFDKMKTQVTSKIEEFKTQAEIKLNNFKTNAITKIEEFKIQAENKFDEFKISATEKIEEIKTNVTEKFENIKNTIEDKINFAKDKVKEAIDKIKGFFNFEWKLPDIKLPHFGIEWDTQGVVAEAFKKIGLQGLPKLKVDWYAEGGFPNAGDLFVANEAGAEWVGSMNGRTAVANNDQISKGVEEASYRGMARALQEYGYAGVTVINKLDSKEIASKTTKVIKSNANMYG